MRHLLKVELVVYPLEPEVFVADYPTEWGGTTEQVLRMPLEYLVVKSFWKHDDHEHVTAAPALSRS